MDYDLQINADLHIHSNASDGTCSPDEIISGALNNGVQIIAITDHDTIAGCAQAIKMDIPPSMQLITGVEISADFPAFLSRKGSIHILGYNIDLTHPGLRRNLESLQESRLNRTPQIISLLNRLGIDISMDELSDCFPKGQIGRPHIAQRMVDKGIAASIDEVFDSYLGNGKPAYVEKQRIPYAAALEMILEAGGIPVLAHPYLISNSSAGVIEDLVKKSIPLGLQGIEAFYPQHSKAQSDHCLDIAGRYDLMVTGGTDFHGGITPNIQIGFGNGGFSVSAKDIAKFMDSIRKAHPHTPCMLS